MSKHEVARMAGGVLVVLIGVGVAVGGVRLRNGAPPSWPDVVAGDSTVRAAAKAMLAVAALLVIAGAAAALGVSGGRAAATVAVVSFVAGGFWANFVLFGDVRLLHTGTNVIVGMLVVWLLW